MSHDDRKFRPWYTPDTARWLRLSLAARGLVAELLRKWDDRGEIRAESAEDIAILLRLSVEEIAPALNECLRAGRLVWDVEDGVLRDPDFMARQRKTSKDWMREKRSRDKSREGCEASDEPVLTAKPSEGCDSSSPLLSSDLISSSEADQISLAGGSSADPPPKWFADVVASVELSCMVDLRVPDCWLRYAGHRGEKGKKPSANDARYWLTTVMVPEAREAVRRAARDRERDAKFKNHAPKVDPPTAAQSKKFQHDLLAELAKQGSKKGAA